MKFHKVYDAQAKKLVQLSTWLFDNTMERDVLARMACQVMTRPERICMYVKKETGQIALFVDDIAEKTGHSKRT